MVSTSGDISRRVGVPSIFIMKHVADRIRGALLANTTLPCVQVSLRAPLGRLPMLVEGSPQTGILEANGYQGYQIWTAPDHDSLSITLSSEFGNPDLFVSSDGAMPNQHEYTWSSRDRGSDTITSESSCALIPEMLTLS